MLSVAIQTLSVAYLSYQTHFTSFISTHSFSSVLISRNGLNEVYFFLLSVGNLREAFKLSESEWLSRFNVNKPCKGDKSLVFYARGPIASSAAVEIAHKMGYKKCVN